MKADIKADWLKYLKDVRDNYDGSNGFPPSVDADKLLGLDEYSEWWLRRKKRLSTILDNLMIAKARS